MEKQALIDGLNEDLAGELSAVIQYITYAAKATGPYRPQLAAFFLAEVVDEQQHAQFLANKIVALGGEPTTVPRPVPEASTNRKMLEAVLEAERKATADYTLRAQQATRASRSNSKTWSATRAATSKRRSGSCRVGRSDRSGRPAAGRWTLSSRSTTGWMDG